ncbi:MAG: hypothetical protein ACRDJF_00975 [Actinomycetota bacterium]
MTSARVAPRGRRPQICLLVALTIAFALHAPMVGAQAVDVGYRDFQYGSGVSAPTGEKPQSKLWFNDGTWWAGMWSKPASEFRVHRLDWSTQTWSDTGVSIDSRAGARIDTLWDGSRLYISSAGRNPSTASDEGRILRYSYDAASDTYSLDPGFPVVLFSGGVEALVMDKDTTGALWITYTRANSVFVAHTTADDLAWTVPYILPVIGATNLDPDDISAIISFRRQVGGDDLPHVGVMWSNQNDEAMYFAQHLDGAPDDQWTLDPAVQGPQYADDHMNLKSLSSDSRGRVYAVTKTNLTANSQPLILLLVLKPQGSWSRRTVSTVADNHTRPILLIDEQNGDLYVFAAAPCCSGGMIYMKKTSLDNISFASGLGTPFIKSSTDPKINNPTSTKQNLNNSTGLVVLAGDDSTKHYLHNSMTLGGPDTTPPETTIDSGPLGTVSSPDAVFTFSSNESGSSFECRLDGAAFSSCASPTTYTGLADGPHTFEVAATDPAGNTDPSPAARTWTVDSDSAGIARESISTTVNATATGSVTIAKPAGTAAGDLLVSCLALNGGSVASTGVPPGWVPIASVTSIANPHIFGYYKVAGASEPADYIWILGSSVVNGGGIARYSGVSEAMPLDGAATASGPSATQGVIPGVTTSVPNVMLAGCMAINSSATSITIASPSGMSPAWDLGGKRHQLSDGLQAGAGASGDKVWTFSTSRAWAGWLAALRPR